MFAITWGAEGAKATEFTDVKSVSQTHWGTCAVVSTGTQHYIEIL